MSIGLDFILRARTAAFTSGIASANNAVKDLKKGIREFDVGGGFKQALGVGGVIAGFRLAITHAQQLRDEAKKAGKEVDRATQSVAEYGDTLGNIFDSAKSGLVSGLSFFTQLGDKARQFFQDVTEEQEDAARKMVETTGKAADEAEARLKKSREENSPEKVAAAREKADAAEAKAMAKGTEAQKTQIDLINERATLEEKIRKAGKGTVEYQNLRAALAENDAAIAKGAKAMDDEAKDKRDDLKKDEKKLIDKFAPTVEELAKQQTGGFVEGNDPRLLARRALAEEDKARALFGRGDFRGGLAAAKKAQGLRNTIEGQTSETGALTPKAAEDAVKEALTDTNDKLDTLTKAVSGIIKAQK